MAKSLGYRIQQNLQKIIKTSYQKLRIIGQKKVNPSCALFVFGAQRSGTRVPMEVMGRSLEIATYREGDIAAFNKVLLKPNSEIRYLLGKSPFPFSAFKPICESHRAGELLDYFDGSKGIWLFRDYKDVVNSGVKKWKDGKSNLVHLASGNLELAGWRAGGLGKGKLQLVKDLYSEKLSNHEARAIMYYLRNDLFFDLKLYQRDKIILVRYEDIVSDAKKYFPKIFEFFGCKFKESFISGIYRTSIGKNSFPRIASEIEDLCIDVNKRLLKHYKNQRIFFPKQERDRQTSKYS